MIKKTNAMLILLALAASSLLINALSGVASDSVTLSSVSPEPVLFPDGLNSNLYKLKSYEGWQTFASSKAIHVVNMLDRTLVYRDTLYLFEEYKGSFFNEDFGLWLIALQNSAAKTNRLVCYDPLARFFTVLEKATPGLGEFLGFVKIDQATVFIHYQYKAFTYNFQTKASQTYDECLDLPNTDRPAVLLDLENLLVYKSNIEAATILNLKTSTKTNLNLPFKPNSIQKVPESKFAFVQTSDSTPNYLIIDASVQTFATVQKVTTSLVTKAALIYAIRSAVLIAENNSFEKHVLTSDGKTDTNYPTGKLIQPAGKAFILANDYSLIYFANALQVQNYDLNTLLVNENFVPASSEVLPHVVESDYFLVKGTSDTYTFRTPLKIVIKKGTQTVKEFAPAEDNRITSGIYLKDQNAWILGYENFVLNIKLSDGAVTRIDSPLFLGKQVKNPIFLEQYSLVAVFMNTDSIVFIDPNTLKITETQKASSVSDRVALKINSTSLLFYSASKNTADIIEPNKTARVWDHKLSPGINYVVNIPDSNFCVVQTSETPKKLYIYNKNDWSQVQEIKETTLQNPSVFVRRNNKNKIYVSEKGQTEVYSISGDFKATLLIKKKEREFSDITVNELKPDEYYVHYSRQPGLTNNFAVFNGANDVMSSSCVDSFFPALYSNGPISPVTNLIPQTSLRTYLTKNSIIIEDNERMGLLVKEVRVIKENIQSFVYIPERTLWILGYNKKILFVNILTWQVQTYTKNLDSDVKGLFIVPNTDNLAIYQPQKPIYLLKFDTSDQPVYAFTPSFQVDLLPLQEKDRLLVFSSNSNYGELFKLSDITNLKPISVWQHGVKGIKQVLKIPKTDFLALQDSQSKISIFSSFNFAKLSDVTLGNVIDGNLLVIQGYPLIMLKNGAKETLWNIDEKGKAVNKTELENRPIYNRILQAGITTYLADDQGEKMYETQNVGKEIVTSFPFDLITPNSFLTLRNSDTMLFFAKNTNTIFFFYTLNMNLVPMYKQIKMPFDEEILSFSEVLKSKNLIVKTLSATYIIDWFTGELVVKLEASNLALGIRNVIFYQSAATNSLIHYDYVKKSVIKTTEQTNKALKGKVVYDDEVNFLDQFFMILAGTNGKNTIVLADLEKIKSMEANFNLYLTDSSCNSIIFEYLDYYDSQLYFLYCAGSNIRKLVYNQADYKPIPEPQENFFGIPGKDIKDAIYSSAGEFFLIYSQEDENNKKIQIDTYNAVDLCKKSTRYITVPDARVIKPVNPGYNALLYKIGGGIEFYNLKKEICDSGLKLISPNPAVNYCETGCASTLNRVFAEGDSCWNECPLNYTSAKFDFSNSLSGNLCSSSYCKSDCFKQDASSSNLALLTFDNFLNATHYNDSLCLLPTVIGIPQTNLVRVDTKAGCGAVSTTKRILSQPSPRILQTLNNINNIQYLVSFKPHLTSFTADITKSWVEMNRDDFIVKFNQAKKPNYPLLKKYLLRYQRPEPKPNPNSKLDYFRQKHHRNSG